MSASINKSTFQFLKDIQKNNDREWFNKHKDKYLVSHENMISFCNELLMEMRKHDNIETSSGKDSLMRIYRDTRFSKDKTPYKTHFGGGFKRATAKLRGGYYFQVGPGESLAAGGFFVPSKEDLIHLRKDIDVNYEDWEKMLKNKSLVKTFGKLRGDKLTTVPRGFDKDHPAIELLRHKSFYFERKFTDKEVLDPSFMKELNQTFKNLRSYFDFMSEVLTTDANGVSKI